MRNVNSNFRSLSTDVSGSMLPMAASGVLMIAALIGGGVDLSRAYKTQNRLQAACDAGVLAGRRAVTSSGFDTTAKAQADLFFNANFNDDAQQASGTEFEPTSDDNGLTVIGEATTQPPTTLMKIFGVNDFDLAVDCTASMGVGNSDIVMVLDTTGSMSDEANGTSPEEGDTTKLEDLQEAMMNFYDTVSGSAEGSNARIRYGFVPYSSTVNVGQLILDLNPDYLVDSHQVQSRQWIAWGEPETSTGTGYSSARSDSARTAGSSLPVSNGTVLRASNTFIGKDVPANSTGTLPTATRATTMALSGMLSPAWADR